MDFLDILENTAFSRSFGDEPCVRKHGFIDIQHRPEDYDEGSDAD